jgi:Tol biopolymer transport system component
MTAMRPQSVPAACWRLAVIALLYACGTEPDSPPTPAADTLAFVIDNSIYVTGVEEGAVPVRLDSGFTNPSWSPDGGTLAMVATGSPNPVTGDIAQALYLADADGGNVRELAGFVREISGPVLWAPDGSSLLFVRFQHGFGPDYQYLVRVPAVGGPEMTIGSFGFSVTASWSRDGSLVAVDSGGVIELIDPATNQVQGLISGGGPRFSPVNDDLAFTEGGTRHIHLIRSDRSADRDLQVAGSTQSWSPDGGRLAFDGTDGVYTIAPDGSGLLRIGPLNMDIGGLAWSPDGSRIAYVASTASGPKTLYVASADDSDRRPLHSGDNLCCPAWRPR